MAPLFPGRRILPIVRDPDGGSAKDYRASFETVPGRREAPSSDFLSTLLPYPQSTSDLSVDHGILRSVT